MKTSIYQFRIELLGSSPIVWRRFRVHDNITFIQLHNIIQLVMGWENYHLFSFSFAHGRIVSAPMFGRDQLATRRLNEVRFREGLTMLYEYDFGDCWQHELKLEKILTTSRKPVPICTHGRRACPPEDCGGIWGYQELLRLMKSKRGRRYREAKEWLGGHFDPSAWYIDEVNVQLANRTLWD
jgi:hypothetical protein